MYTVDCKFDAGNQITSYFVQQTNISRYALYQFFKDLTLLVPFRPLFGLKFATF